MPINPEAIEHFLYKEPPPSLPVRGADPAWLRKMIKLRTGVDYRPKLAPRIPQLEGLALACYAERALMTFGMRMGKSKLALDWAALWRQAKAWKGPGLIIAHAPVGVDVWLEQAAEHSDLSIIGIQAGPGSLGRLFDAIEADADLIVMAWPALTQIFTEKRLVSRGRHKGKPKLYPNYALLRDVAPLFNLAIIDEIHRAKDPQGLWFQLASELVQAATFRMGLTGTPVGRDPYAIWAQAFLIDGGQALSTSFRFFEQAFARKQVKASCPYEDCPGSDHCSRVKCRQRRSILAKPVFDKAKMPLLQAKLEPFSLSYKLEDVQEVNVIRGTVRLRMTPAQRTAYQKVLEDAIALEDADAGMEDKSNNFMKRRAISSGFDRFPDEDGKALVHYFPDSPKLAWLADLASGLDGDVQVIVFYEFTPSGRAICSLLDKAKQPYGWLWSGTRDRSATIADFKAGKSRWLIANSGSGSMALDLPMADYLLFYESPTSNIIRAQAEARPLSRGAKPLLVDDLICSPVEDRILGFIREGKDALAAITSVRSERGFFRKR